MVGLVLGIFVGVLPGLGGPNGVAILLPLLRSAVIGCWLGITPGGAIAASFMGYNQ